MGRVAALPFVSSLIALAACGRNAPGKPAPEHHDAPAAVHPAELVEFPARPLGMAELAGFEWRKRAGQPPFRTARKAEDRGDWPAAVAACREALAADPGHLDAAWLLAIGLAKLGKPDEVVEPLAVAVAGDFGKWATVSLEHPALQPFLATPAGQAWRRRVEADRQTYLAALARAVIVTAGGDLFAYDGEGVRWYRLTRTAGAVVGALAVPAAHRLAYLTRERVHKHDTKVAVGIVDLSLGRTTHPQDLGSTAPIVIAYGTAKPAGFWIGPATSPAPGHAWARQLDDDGRLLPAKPPRPPGPWLSVTGRTAHLHRLPVASVSADWDDQSLASAIRIGTSNRIVTVPSPGLIDGNTATWSPDHAHLAFVAQLDDHCTPGAISAAAFVADAATGTVSELERATRGLAIEWLGERKLAVAGDHGVSIVELGGAAAVPVAGADGLASPRRKPRCTPEPADEPAPDEEPGELGVGDEPTDAGVGADAGPR